MRSTSLTAVLTAAMLAIAQALPRGVLHNRTLSFPYGSVKVRGVNLGGWFVLEPWITPSLFDNGTVDERTLCQSLGSVACSARLSKHWHSFYTAADFRQIRAAGLNHVRIPLGYWAVAPLPGDPFVQGQLAVLDQALGWAALAGLKVWIDLHGAPGSQNGFDNSGQRGQVRWQTGAGNVEHTKHVIRQLAEKYAAPRWNNVVVGIELVNEPLGPVLDMDQLRQYYLDGWGITRQSGDIAVVISDAFTPPNAWNGFMTNLSHVILDVHHYEVFSPGEVAMPIDRHVAAVCAVGRSISAGAVDKWTVVGEWSGALSDCAHWLNGVGRGSRYDGSFSGSSPVGSCATRMRGSVSQLTPAERQNTRKYIEAQLDAYERGVGWIFWTWKTEAGAPEWEMRDLIHNGVFPQPLTGRQFPNQCGF